MNPIIHVALHLLCGANTSVDITGSLKYTDTFLLITAQAMHGDKGENRGWSVIKRILILIIFFFS